MLPTQEGEQGGRGGSRHDHSNGRMPLGIGRQADRQADWDIRSDRWRFGRAGQDVALRGKDEEHDGPVIRQVRISGYSGSMVAIGAGHEANVVGRRLHPASSRRVPQRTRRCRPAPPRSHLSCIPIGQDRSAYCGSTQTNGSDQNVP